MYQDQKKKQRLLTIGVFVGLFMVLVAVAVIFAIVESRKSVTLDIMVAPQSAEILLNGKKYENGTQKIEPGKYEISITHEELESYQETREFTAGEEAKLYVILAGPDGDMSWYATHRDDVMIVVGIGDYYADIESKEYVASDPVFTITPYQNYDKGFKVNAQKGEDGAKTEIIIYLYTCDEKKLSVLKNNAIDWLNKKGIDLDNYTLTYKYCSEE